jgi:hypothetical protein
MCFVDLLFENGLELCRVCYDVAIHRYVGLEGRGRCWFDVEGREAGSEPWVIYGFIIGIYKLLGG